VSKSRLLPPLIAIATLVLLFANALPCSMRKRMLREERVRLLGELRHEREREERLLAENFALEHDPFSIERACLETWRLPPPGALPPPWESPPPPDIAAPPDE
jgi:hypothetical protein